MLNERRFAGVFEAIAFAVPLVLFVSSISSQPAGWDTAEMQGVPYILGIAHPTGFPLYTLIGYAFTHLAPMSTVAFRMNVLSAVYVSSACVVLFSLARLLDVPGPCALAGSLWFAVTGVAWTHAIRADVHALALLFCALTVFWSVRWLKGGDTRCVLYAGAALGCALATHPIAIWLLPGLVVAGVVRTPPRSTLAAAAGVVILSLTLYLYLPIRSSVVVAHHLDPTVSLAGVTGGLFWNYNDPSTWSGLVAELSGSQFGAGQTVLAAFSPTNLQTYLWDWLGTLNSAYGAFGIVLAFIGLVRVWGEDWKIALVLLLLGLGAVPFSYAYAAVEADPDRYRLLSLWLVAILIGASAVGRQRNGNVALIRGSLVCVAMLVWAAATFQNNSGMLANRTDLGGRPLITQTSKRIAPGSVIVTQWLDATTLAYAAYVDGSLKGRIVVAGWPGDYGSAYTAWREPVYLITGASPPHVDGVAFRRLRPIDASHQLWRVLPAHSRDPYTNRKL